MCFISEPSLKNVVVCFKVPACKRGGIRWLLVLRSRKDRHSRRNHFLFRPTGVAGPKGNRGLAFTVFPDGGSVIGTGIKNYEGVQPALDEFAFALGGLCHSRPESWQRRVVNSTYSGGIICCEKRVSTCRTLARYDKEGERESKKGVSLFFRPQFFPGVLVRVLGQGSLNVFNNGRYVLIGVKRRRNAKKLYTRLCALMEMFWTISGTRTSCAWTAASCLNASSESVAKEDSNGGGALLTW
jgi:TATA-box binding protein (TBP) (component of TFIID and TFIIIB)